MDFWGREKHPISSCLNLLFSKSSSFSFENRVWSKQDASSSRLLSLLITAYVRLCWSVQAILLSLRLRGDWSNCDSQLEQIGDAAEPTLKTSRKWLGCFQSSGLSVLGMSTQSVRSDSLDRCGLRSKNYTNIQDFNDWKSTVLKGTETS